jgi:hypothetical protein
VTALRVNNVPRLEQGYGRPPSRKHFGAQPLRRALVAGTVTLLNLLGISRASRIRRSLSWLRGGDEGGERDGDRLWDRGKLHHRPRSIPAIALALGSVALAPLLALLSLLLPLHMECPLGPRPYLSPRRGEFAARVGIAAFGALQHRLQPIEHLAGLVGPLYLLAGPGAGSLYTSGFVCGCVLRRGSA